MAQGLQSDYAERLPWPAETSIWPYNPDRLLDGTSIRIDGEERSVHAEEVTRLRSSIGKGRLILVGLLWPLAALCVSPTTLEDLKKLEIICFEPTHLPAGFRLKEVQITNDAQHEEFDDAHRQLPLYAIIYGNEANATFSIESAREGIGDRNIMEEEDSEETEIQTPLGPMYLIYRPKGKSGRKVEILTNWVTDANMKAEKAKDPTGHPVLGRYHGFSATGITLVEFGEIVQSLRPIRASQPKP